jgi:hypothetical protein
MARGTTPRTTTTTTTRAPRTTRTTRSKKTESSPLISIDSSLTHEAIASRAYQIFLADGAAHGRDVDHWLKAERELRNGSVQAES